MQNLHQLFDDALFEVFGEVGTDLGGGTFSGDLGDVVFYHELDKLFEAGLVGVPLELCLHPQTAFIGEDNLNSLLQDFCAQFLLQVLINIAGTLGIQARGWTEQGLVYGRTINRLYSMR